MAASSPTAIRAVHVFPKKRLPKTQFGRATLAASGVIFHSFHLVTGIWVTGCDIHFPHRHTANQNCEDALLKTTLELLS